MQPCNPLFIKVSLKVLNALVLEFAGFLLQNLVGLYKGLYVCQLDSLIRKSKIFNYLEL